MQTQNKIYYNGIDALKGVLVIIVFLGHILSEMSFAGHIIYSFHMPLFICVSGFLINISFLSSERLGSIVKKYWWRFVLPWAIAVPIFYIFRFYSQFSVSGLLMAFVRPYRHLWYVPAICFYIAIVVCVEKCTKKFISQSGRWAILFLFALIGALLFKFELFGLISMDGSAGIYFIEHVLTGFRPQYFVFFVFGAWLRNRIDSGSKILKNIWGWSVILVTVGLALVYWTYYFHRYEGSVRVIVFYAFNLALCYSMLKIATGKQIVKLSLLEFIGRYSLPLYLYHFLGKVVSLWWFDEFSTEFYLFNVVYFVLLIVGVYFLRKVVFVDRYIFGNVRG